MQTLMARVKKLEQENVFLGSPPHLFEIGGRKQLITLLNEGLNPESRVLDIGCGCLRGGYWLIHFLNRGCYFGIEPNRKMLDAGITILLEPWLRDLKQPRFDHNADFDFSVFGEQFDFFVARSIWTHASKKQIQKMIREFICHSIPSVVFVTSYVRSTSSETDYSGDHWVGRSHESDTPGIIRHSLEWIQSECANKGLTVDEIKDTVCNFGGQTWLRIKRSRAAGGRP